MTTKETPNEDVQAVLDYIEKRTFRQPKLLWYNGDRMRVEIDLSGLASDGKASIIEWHIRRNWNFDRFETTKDIAEMSGRAYEVE